MLMHDAAVLRFMAKHSQAMAKAADRGEKPTELLTVAHKRLTAELSAVELLLSLEQERFKLEAALKAGRKEKVAS